MNNNEFIAWLKGYLTAKEETGLISSEISIILQKLRLSEGTNNPNKTLLKG
jgi:hypothetical protein